ncbi:AAA family ATPase [Pedobacter psychrodurus]|uniref:AAA family ATPase n=1 Tax=Pedobacter psychrodurus TaxID=2530456 RepID=A0A4R0PXX5_9SPHI|nr:AAA family ATPase [Pedobacter psychrodurus]TCD27783.1 AAA family ATPase [Pedobacter psychrodurus]
MDFKGYILSMTVEGGEAPSSYPFNIPCLQDLVNLDFHPSVTFFTGENGVGKSTLIESLAVNLGFNAEGGSKNFNFSTSLTHSDLHKYLRVTKGTKKMTDGYFLRSESFYNLATAIDGYDSQLLNAYGGISLHQQSHGESFWSLFMNRFRGNGLYILDEPESALSVTRQMAMISQIHKLVEKKSQFIIVTHSPILLSYPDAIIYEMSVEGLRKVEYEECEVFKIYKAFLNAPNMMLDRLLR